MGKRYGKLPSEILREADSFDIMVMDVANTYENYQNAKQNNKDVSKFVDQSELEAYHNKVTGRDT